MRFRILLIALSPLFTLYALPPTAFEPRGLGGGGALFCPSINPANDNEYYVGCDMSELFHTTDFGTSYELLPFRQIQGGNYATIRFTTRPDLLYAISHKSEGGNDAVQPVRSRDKGKTWQTLPGNPDPSEVTYSIFVDYNHPERLVIAYYGALYFSSDSGTNFKNIHDATVSANGVVVGGAFFTGDSIYFGTSDGLLVSINGGSSFLNGPMAGIAAGEKIFSFVGGKEGNTIRFFCLTGAEANLYPGLPGSDYWDFLKGVYTLDAGVTTWTKRMNGITVGDDFLMFTAMAENNIATAYLGGSDSRGFPNIMKTVDGGISWAPIFEALSSADVPNKNIHTGWSGQGGDRGWGYGECVFGLAVAPQNVNKVIYSDFGFIHKTSDGGATWQQAYVALSDQHPVGVNTPKGESYTSIGLENTTCWQITWADSQNLFACYSDIGGMRSTDGGKRWSFNFSGHSANSMYRIAQASSGILYAGTSNIHDMYQSTRLTDAILDVNDAQGKVIYSSDKGATWQLLHLFSHPVFWVALDPNNQNTLYASVIHSTSGGIYVSHNIQNGATSTWTKLPNPPRTEGHPASIVVLNDSSVVCTYSGRRTTAFTASSGVFHYRPSTMTWTDLSDAGMRYWTKDIVIDPNDPTENTWYACVFSGWGGAPNGLGGLYKTINRGQAWTRINNLDRVTSCVFAPGLSGEMYFTTETEGLWTTQNVNLPTPLFTQVTAYDFRQPERLFFSPYDSHEIWVTSFGNGMKTGRTGPVAAIESRPLLKIRKGNFEVYSAQDGLFASVTLLTAGRINLSLYDVNGRRLRLDDMRFLPAGTHRFKTTFGHLPSSPYVVKARINGQTYSRLVNAVK